MSAEGLPQSDWALYLLVDKAMRESWDDATEYEGAPHDITAALIAAGYVSPEQHARELREARAEGWALAHDRFCGFIGTHLCIHTNPYAPEGDKS